MFEAFKHYCESYGYIVLCAGVMLENAGIPVPGETAVVAAGFMASVAGGQVFDIRLVIVMTIVAAVIGDNIGFWLGRELARPRLKQGKGFLFLNKKTLAVAEEYFARFGSWTIFFARFITGIRVIGALAAGTSGMEWRRFLVANATGAAAWATTFGLLGYYFGQNWDLLERWIGRTGLVLLAVAIVGGYLLWRYRERWMPQSRPSGASVGAASSDRDSRTVE
jgi:membrane protein DedA with SNARE-associated domain